MAVTPRELHRVVPTVLIYNEEGKFLLIKRSPDLKIFLGKWHGPGGGLSMDDYEHLPSKSSEHKQWENVLEIALHREVKEESGFEIGTPEYMSDVVFIRPDGIPVIVLRYFAPYTGGSFVPSEEATEYVWVTTEESRKYDLINGIQEEIENVDKILKERRK